MTQISNATQVHSLNLLFQHKQATTTVFDHQVF